MLANVVDVLVNLVSNHNHVGVLQQNVLQGLQLSLAIYRTCGVAGRAKDKSLCLRSDSCLQLSGCNLEVLLDGSLYEDGSSLSQQYHLGIAYPVGSGDDNLVTSIYQCHDGVADTLLGTVATENLAGSIVQTILVLQFVNDGLLQFGVTRNGRVTTPVVLYCLNGGSLNVVGCVEVGFAHAHVNNINALSLQLAAALTHCQSGTGCQSVQSVG